MTPICVDGETMWTQRETGSVCSISTFEGEDSDGDETDRCLVSRCTDAGMCTDTVVGVCPDVASSSSASGVEPWRWQSNIRMMVLLVLAMGFSI